MIDTYWPQGESLGEINWIWLILRHYLCTRQLVWFGSSDHHCYENIFWSTHLNRCYSGAYLFTIIHVRSFKFLKQFQKLTQKIRRSKSQLYVSISQDRWVSHKSLGQIIKGWAQGLNGDRCRYNRNNCPNRVFLLSREILGCAIDLVDGAQCKCKRWFVF